MKQSLTFWRLSMLISAILSSSALYRMIWVMQYLKISILQPKWLFLVAFFALITVLGFVFFGLTWNEKTCGYLAALEEYTLKSPVINKLAALLFVLLLCAFSWLVVFSPIRGLLMTNTDGTIIVFGEKNGLLRISGVTAEWVKNGGLAHVTFYTTSFQWWLFWVCGLIAALILKMSRKGLSLGKSFLIALLGEALIFKIISFIPSISPDPFSLTWSEGSRWYYASLFVSKRLYGQAFLPSFIDPPLDLLNSIPFLIGNLPIWVYRLWSVLLSLGVAIATGLLLARRLRISDRLVKWTFTALCVLYLFQEGGIYYHLLLAVLIVLFGVSLRKPWLTLTSVILASFWVGMDRVNWYPVPGMLATVFFLLEEPTSRYRTLTHYLLKPIIWLVAGMCTAILGSIIVMWMTGADLSVYGSSFTSSLLWYRLFPNPTYQFGVLPAILFVSLPIWLVIAWGLRKRQWHDIRLLGLFGILLVLFIGGLVSSVKIGGGADLHNMDAYMMLLLVVGGYIYLGQFIPDESTASYRMPWFLTILAIAIPVGFALRSAPLIVPFDSQASQNNLQILNDYVKPASGEGEVLFISQRQLITFNYVKNITLIPDYDLVTLTEMVMSNNKTYLDGFTNDLHTHRFKLIVVGPLYWKMKGAGYAFGEENDVWVQRVSKPLLCEYEPVTTLPNAELQLFVPKSGPTNCP